MRKRIIQNYCRNFFLIFYALLFPVVSDGCTFTSANSTTFTVGEEGMFRVDVKPNGKKMEMIGSPDWLHLSRDVDGSFILYGIPPVESATSYELVFVSFSSPVDRYCSDFCAKKCGASALCNTHCVSNCLRKGPAKTAVIKCTQIFTLNIKGAKGSIPDFPKHLVVNQISSADEQIRAKSHSKEISFHNVISWKAPKQRSKIVSYRIYSGDRLENLLLAVIPSSDKKRFRVIDPNANPCHVQKYHVVSVDAFGNVSEPVSAKIKGTKHDCAIFKREAKEESDSSSSR